MAGKGYASPPPRQTKCSLPRNRPLFAQRLCRSAPVLGRSDVARITVQEKQEMRPESNVAAPDGRIPSRSPALRIHHPACASNRHVPNNSAEEASTSEKAGPCARNLGGCKRLRRRPTSLRAHRGRVDPQALATRTNRERSSSGRPTTEQRSALRGIFGQTKENARGSHGRNLQKRIIVRNGPAAEFHPERRLRTDQP